MQLNFTDDELRDLENVYLNESRLGTILNRLFPSAEWVHDKPFLERKRPDYRSDKLKLIIEFDGYMHYVKPTVILNDEYKTKLYESNGYKVVRIPHYIQLDTDSIKHFFSIDCELDLGYPQGFNDYSNPFPPAWCCELGVERFESEFNSLLTTSAGKRVANKILISIKRLIDKFEGKTELVLPKKLTYLKDLTVLED